jgi:hypothetical protein
MERDASDSGLASCDKRYRLHRAAQLEKRKCLACEHVSMSGEFK